MASRSAAPTIGEILAAKRDGEELSRAAIESFVDGVVDSSVSRPQAAAFLAFAYLNGLSPREAVDLTRAMTDRGERLRWEATGGPLVDKHSTGGVGDKVSLVLAPLWAALGKRVPMISGRGLGHTGGTLDKLEAIPGYRVDLSVGELRQVLGEVGCFISGQTGQIAPADRILYALRDETQTVPSVPLITASILSKKLAEGIDALVLDVKYGSGAFMPTRARAQELADMLVTVGDGAGLRTRAVLSSMEQPLGHAVGNALEVDEAIACLRGGGPADLRELVLALADDERAAAALDDGTALERFFAMVRAQGGDPDAGLRGRDRVRTAVIRAPHSGVLTRCEALAVGRASFVLGAGRRRAGEPIHHGVGVYVHHKLGEAVRAGEPLFTVHHVERGLDTATALLTGAVSLGDAPVDDG